LFIIPLAAIIRKFESAAPDLVLRRMKRVALEDLVMKKEIGKGSFGRVMLAEYENRLVVVKVRNGFSNKEYCCCII
jgi:predicted Ser/Thr protein kinase